MMKLPLLTWIRFAYWLIIGLFIYFLYGINHSRLNEEKLSFFGSFKKHIHFIIPTVLSFILLTWYITIYLGSAMTVYHRITDLMTAPDAQTAIKRYIQKDYVGYEKEVELYTEYVKKNNNQPLPLLKKPLPGLDKAEFLMKAPEENKSIEMIMELTPMGWKITISRHRKSEAIKPGGGKTV